MNKSLFAVPFSFFFASLVRELILLFILVRAVYVCMYKIHNLVNIGVAQFVCAVEAHNQI